MLERARRSARRWWTRGLSAERPVAILSENDLEHLTLALGAMWAGIPFAPISSAYSLMSSDFGKLRHILAHDHARASSSRSRPGLRQGDRQRSVARDTEVVTCPAWHGPRRPAVTPFADLLGRPQPGPGRCRPRGDRRRTRIVKFLFTSGSTKDPRASSTRTA